MCDLFDCDDGFVMVLDPMMIPCEFGGGRGESSCNHS